MLVLLVGHELMNSMKSLQFFLGKELDPFTSSIAIDGLEEHQGCRVLSEMGSGGEVQGLQVTGVSIITYYISIGFTGHRLELQSEHFVQMYDLIIYFS